METIYYIYGKDERGNDTRYNCPPRQWLHVGDSLVDIYNRTYTVIVDNYYDAACNFKVYYTTYIPFTPRHVKLITTKQQKINILGFLGHNSKTAQHTLPFLDTHVRSLIYNELLKHHT